MIPVVGRFSDKLGRKPVYATGAVLAAVWGFIAFPLFDTENDWLIVGVLILGLVIHALMYAFFRASTGIEARRVTPPDADLAAAGFTLVRRELSNFGLLHADLWARPAA